VWKQTGRPSYLNVDELLELKDKKASSRSSIGTKEIKDHISNKKRKDMDARGLQVLNPDAQTSSLRTAKRYKGYMVKNKAAVLAHQQFKKRTGDLLLKTP
jgi:hypothetical protein